MMKCPYCGSPLDLDDNFCSHCGKLNEQVRQHVEDMQRYQSEFTVTKEEVYKTTERYKGISVRVVIIAILLILNVIAAIVLGQSYSIVRSINQSKSDRNYEEYSAILDGYLQDGDYMAFYAFMDEHDILYDYDSKYMSYDYIRDLISKYKLAYEYILGYVEDPSGSYSTENVLYYINSFYERQNTNYYYDEEGKKSELEQQALADMNWKMERMLITFCNVSEEDAAAFSTYSSAERAYIVEEGLKNAE